MIRVRAAARLHFGLLNPLAAEPWGNVDGEAILPARRFGGVGLMVEEPALVLRAEPASAWSADGPLSDRALEASRRFESNAGRLGLPPHGERLDWSSERETASNTIQPLALTIEQAPPAHAGFGSGTQLALTVARAITLAMGQSDWPAELLAQCVGRGERSGVGVHGFDRGGLIVEAGKRGNEPVAPLLLREEFPEDWRIVIVLPEAAPGLHGAAERLTFNQMRHQSPTATETLCRLVLLGMLPALRERDCRTFGEALYDFNARVGELFAGAQGGRYATPRSAELVAALRRAGARGAGQSSWGPALFGIAEDEQLAAHIATQLRQEAAGTIWVTKAAQGCEWTC